MTEMKSSIAQALAKAQAEMGKAVKDTLNPHFKMKYADLSSVVDACFPALNKHGISVLQPIRRDDIGLSVETVFLHESGESLSCAVPLIVNKNDMQGLGSAITYARRYGLMCMAGIAPEDDDGNAAASSPPQRQDRAAFKPDALVARIASCTSGKELLTVLNDAPGDVLDHPAIKAARVDQLRLLVMDAKGIPALDAMSKAFAQDWADVKADAETRKAQLQEAPF